MNQFRDIDEFLISSLLLKGLIGRFSEEIPSDKDTSSPLNNRKPSSPTDLAPGQA